MRWELGGEASASSQPWRPLRRSAIAPSAHAGAALGERTHERRKSAGCHRPLSNEAHRGRSYDRQMPRGDLFMLRRQVTEYAAVFAVLLVSGCAGTSAAVLRFHPPALGEGDTVDAQQLRVEGAVRDVAAVGRLSCTPDKPRLLSCWPANPGSSPAFVSMHLERDTEGYVVNVLESSGGFSGPRQLCSIQDRLVERIELRAGGGTVRRDTRVSCPKAGR